jgi:hypothetical protein
LIAEGAEADRVASLAEVKENFGSLRGWASFGWEIRATITNGKEELCGF